jgi:hypothetical protein
MRHPATRFRSFTLPVRVLMVQQFTINLSFYMLMPQEPVWPSAEDTPTWAGRWSPPF